MMDGPEGDAPLEPVGGCEIHMTTASRKGSDQYQYFVVRQRIQLILLVDNTSTLSEFGRRAKSSAAAAHPPSRRA